MVTEVTIATSNAGKVREIASSLADLKFKCRSMADFDIDSPEENGTSFIENALIKAYHASAVSHLPALADDSGLVVPALDGAPGIYSARYAGCNASDQDNIDHLLEHMQGLKKDQRQAYFYCALVWVQHPKDPVPLVFCGRCEGEIVLEQSGSGGFGYDSVFYLPQLNKTMAEISMAEKNALSHRGQALGKLKQYLLANGF